MGEEDCVLDAYFKNMMSIFCVLVQDSLYNIFPIRVVFLAFRNATASRNTFSIKVTAVHPSVLCQMIFHRLEQQVCPKKHN